mmetsp:Transcript_38293/g.113514  ORF Transcript_38293/g.113514 Transcript_38293/m.113514 type:complete len:269 (-) Transcript_38293:3984-4790(-)
MQRRDRKNRRSYAVLNFDLSEREPCGTASWTGLVFWFWPVIAVRGSIIQAASLSGFFSSSLSVGISLFCPASGRTVIVAGQQRRASTILCVLDHLLQGFGVTDQPPILACKLFQAILALILVQQTQLHVLVVCWVFPPQRAVPVVFHRVLGAPWQLTRDLAPAVADPLVHRHHDQLLSLAPRLFVDVWAQVVNPALPTLLAAAPRLGPGPKSMVPVARDPAPLALPIQLNKLRQVLALLVSPWPLARGAASHIVISVFCITTLIAMVR